MVCKRTKINLVINLESFQVFFQWLRVWRIDKNILIFISTSKIVISTSKIVISTSKIVARLSLVIFYQFSISASK